MKNKRININFLKKKEIYLFGLGKTGKIILEELLNKKIKIKYIIDNFTKIKRYKNIQIIKEKDLLFEKKAVCLIALYNHYINLNDTQLRLNNYFDKTYNIFQFKNLIDCKKLGYFIRQNNILYKNRNKLNYLAKKLKDKKSLDTLYKINKFRESGKLTYYPIAEKNIYFLNKKFSLKKKINIADIGAYDGSFSKKIFNKYKSIINNIVLFEPDNMNYKKLKKTSFFKRKKFEISNTIISNKIKKISFSHFGSNSSGINLIDKKKNAKAIALDNYKKNFNIIKMDIEGEELNALKGMKKNIVSNLPFILISIYHKWDDIFKIPQYLDKMKINYKYYLRCHEQNTFGTVLYCLPQKNKL